MSGATVAAVLLGSIGLIITVVLGWYLIQVIAYWKIFTKAGEAGWKSLIPFYNSYILYKICWNTTMFWIAFIGTTVGASIYNTGNSIYLIGGVIALAAYFISFICWHKLSLAFGHGIVFTLGLIFLNPIFILILAFNHSQYQRPQ